MSERLLSELFPIFVKKEYLKSQRVSQGPFGEGLEKARTYLKPGEQSPEGANVQTGPQGGKYFDDMGGGGAATQDPSAQGGYDIDYGDPERSAQVREELDQQGMGVPPAPEAGPKISEDRNVVGGIDYGPAKPEIKPEDVDYGPNAPAASLGEAQKFSGGVQGKPDAPEGSSHEQSAVHHHEALRHHGAMAAQSEKRAKKLAAKAPNHPMTLRGQATAQGHREAQAYHQDQFDQHQAAGAGYDPEEANRQKQGAIYGWD